MRKIILCMMSVFLLCACSNEKAVKGVVENYIDEMSVGEISEANTYLTTSQEETTIESMAAEAGYTGKIKSYFSDYMKMVIGKQWESYEITDVQQGEGYYLVSVNVKGISAKKYRDLDQSELVSKLQDSLEISTSESDKEKAFKFYFKECKKQVDTLSLIKRKLVFKVIEKDKDYKIESIDLDE